MIGLICFRVASVPPFRRLSPGCVIARERGAGVWLRDAALLVNIMAFSAKGEGGH